MARVKFGPQSVVPSYTVKVQGEHGCAVMGREDMVPGQVACYLESRPTGVVDVFYSEHCAVCSGSGRIAGKRRMSWHQCKVCNGEPDLFEAYLGAHYGSEH